MALQLITYVSVAIFLLFCLLRLLRYARMPIHLRWELYPIPHEKGREHGGSYFEEVDWWTKTRKKDRFRPLKFMVSEILLLRALYHENKPLWYASFPFHLGLYLYCCWVALVLLGSILGLAGVAIGGSGSAFGSLVYYLTTVVGICAFVIGGLGVLGLLQRRLTDERLKPYTSFKDFFNLLLVLGLFVTGLVAGMGESGLAEFYVYMMGLLAFSEVSLSNGAVVAHILVVALFMAYFPFTHMTHAFMKWFTWHEVRWADEPNLPGSRVEARVRAVLSHQPAWKAPHIRAGDGKTWAQVAADTGLESDK